MPYLFPYPFDRFVQNISFFVVGVDSQSWFFLLHLTFYTGGLYSVSLHICREPLFSCCIFDCFLDIEREWEDFTSENMYILERERGKRETNGLLECLWYVPVVGTWREISVTSKKSPNVYKSRPKMISLEKLMILTPLQKLPKNVGDLGKLIVAKGFENLPKVQ